MGQQGHRLEDTGMIHGEKVRSEVLKFLEPQLLCEFCGATLSCEAHLGVIFADTTCDCDDKKVVEEE